MSRIVFDAWLIPYCIAWDAINSNCGPGIIIINVAAIGYEIYISKAIKGLYYLFQSSN